MEIYKKDNKIIVEIDYWSKRFNPYMSNEKDVGKYPTLTGLIIKHRKGGNNYDEIGFAQTIDRDYKDKGDDVGDFIIKWHEGEKEFIEKCEELGLGIVKMNL